MPKGLRKIDFIFGKTGLTCGDGLSLFTQFCKSLGLRGYLQGYLDWPLLSQRISSGGYFLAHIFAIVAGIGRIANTQSLISNGLIPPILGFTDFPHQDTLRTFLWRFKPVTVKERVAKIPTKSFLANALYGNYNRIYFSKFKERFQN